MPDRYEKLAQVGGLIMSRGATQYGRKVPEMIEERSCSRRTMERMLAALHQACLDIEEVRTQREKCWRMRSNRLVGAVRMTAGRIAKIEPGPA